MKKSIKNASDITILKDNLTDLNNIFSEKEISKMNEIQLDSLIQMRLDGLLLYILEDKPKDGGGRKRRKRKQISKKRKNRRTRSKSRSRKSRRRVKK